MSINWQLTGGDLSWRDLSTSSIDTTTIHDNYYAELLLEKEKLKETRLNVELLLLKSLDVISSEQMLNLIKMLKSSDVENHIVAEAIIEKFNKEIFK